MSVPTVIAACLTAVYAYLWYRSRGPKWPRLTLDEMLGRDHQNGA